METPATPPAQPAAPAAPTVDPAVLIANASLHGDGIVGNIQPAAQPATPPPAEPPPAPPAVNDGRAAAPATPPAEPPAAPDAPPAPPAAEDAIDKYLKSLESPAAAPAAVDDKFKAAFKELFGTDDIESFRNERATTAEQLNTFKTKADERDAMLERFGKMPYEVSKILEAVAKGEDYQQYVRDLHNGVSVAKEAKDIDRYALVDHQFKGKFTAEQVQSLRDGTAAPELIEAHDQWYALAAERHNGARAVEMQRLQTQTQAQKAFQENLDRSAVAAVAYMKNDPALNVLLDADMQEAFLNGTLEQKVLRNADGTYKPEALALLTKATKYDAVLERARKGARVEAANEATLRAHDRMPAHPVRNGAERSAPPAPPKTQDEQARAEVNKAMAEALKE